MADRPRPNHAQRHAARGQAGQRQPGPLTEAELWARALALVGSTLGEVARGVMAVTPKSAGDVALHNARFSKGFVGRLIEDALGADRDAGERPDFVHLGIELKTIPVLWRQASCARWVADASPFVCSIDMLAAGSEHWETSRLKRRLGAVLFVPVASESATAFDDRTILRPTLWRPSLAQQNELKADWEMLMGAIGAGQAETLCARQGKMLQVRPKAAHSRMRTLAPTPGGVGMARPLGFYLRAKVVSEILSLF